MSKAVQAAWRNNWIDYQNKMVDTNIIEWKTEHGEKQVVVKDEAGYKQAVEHFEKHFGKCPL